MDNFVNRLEFILNTFDYSASSFADKIGVQRSSLSHLLSGRNKPSLDFIMKIDEAFPELSLEWILKGTGNYLEKENTTTITKIIQTPTSTPISNSYTDDLFTTNQIAEKSKIASEKNENRESENKSFSPERKVEEEINHSHNNFAFGSNKGDIDQVVIFYKDGTFSQFKPR